MVVSFTKTAAIKIATQKSRHTGLTIDLPKANVGTLHSICYHALKSPTIIETDSKLLRLWNEDNGSFVISGQTVSVVDDVADENERFGSVDSGDKILNQVNILRNKMIPSSKWLPRQINFYKKWCDFKNEVNAVDFTDLIENCLKDFAYAPVRPSIIFVDEAQDMTKLQLTLIRSWAFDCEWLVLVGDDDQVLFRFSGASPEAFLEPPVPDNMKIVLKQSYRVPKKILERAMIVIKKIKNREEKEYQPRKDFIGDVVEGRVYENAANWRRPSALIVLLKNYLEQNKTVMFLTSCSYMLAPIIEELRKNGIPFHNPFRKKNFKWNPIQSGGTGVSATEILTNFLSNGVDPKYWNVPQFVTWAQFIKTSDTGLIRGRGKAGIEALKKAIENSEAGLHTTKNVIGQLLTESAIKNALNRDITWLQDNLLSTRKNGMKYPALITRKHGIEALENKPKVIVGTVHSVKGEDSDVVILFPDISWQAYDECKTQEGKDSMYRVFYVGMTRAREDLIICEPSVRGGHQASPRLYIKI